MGYVIVPKWYVWYKGKTLLLLDKSTTSHLIDLAQRFNLVFYQIKSHFQIDLMRYTFMPQLLTPVIIIIPSLACCRSRENTLDRKDFNRRIVWMAECRQHCSTVFGPVSFRWRIYECQEDGTILREDTELESHTLSGEINFF